MPGGGATVATYQKKEPSGAPGPPFPLTSADDGLSVNVGSGKIVLGNDFGDPLQQAIMFDSREINTDTNVLSFDIFGDWSLPQGNQVYMLIGQDVFSGVHGVNFGTNYTVYDPIATGGLQGMCLSAVEFATTFGWVRAQNNDGFVFGYLYGLGAGFNNVGRINFFDNGSTTFNSQAGTYPESQDVPQSSIWNFFGTLSIYDGLNADHIDFDPGGFAQIFVNAADWSATVPQFLLVNQSLSGGIVGGNNPDIGGDILSIRFINGEISLLQSGNIMLLNNGNDSALVDNGAILQIPQSGGGGTAFSADILGNVIAKGDVNVNGNLNISAGGTATLLLQQDDITFLDATSDWSTGDTGMLVFANLTNQFLIAGLNDAGLGGDLISFMFEGNALMQILLSGNFLFSNSASGALADSGSLAQFFGDVDVKGNLNVSTGATGTFLSADAKTITVTKGIITSIV